MARPFSVMVMDYINPKKMYFWILLLLLLLGFGAYHIFSQNKKNKKIQDVPNSEGSNGDVEVMIFTVDWCPHCKNAKAPWNDFKNTYHGKKVNGRVVRCSTYDLTEGNPDYEKNNQVAKKYGIDGYPTLKMVKDGEVIEFDAKISTYSLERFVEDMV
jgi:glutaredoxin